MSSHNPDTRTRILQAALDLLEAGHGGGVRMTDIAKRARISRQAVYLHFSTRAELLIAATLYFDDLKEIDQRLLASRTAKTGEERLREFIKAWGNYIPEMYGASKALMVMRDTDKEAAQAWDKRMGDMREGCEAAIGALHRDQMLSSAFTPVEATDLLWTMLLVPNWEQLTIQCGWPQETYIENLSSSAFRLFVAQET